MAIAMVYEQFPGFTSRVCAYHCVCGSVRCTTWPESKSPVIKDLSLLLGSPKVVPSELAKRTENQGEKRNSSFLIVVLFNR